MNHKIKTILSGNNVLLWGILAVFIVSKIPFLSLPYYWDEAWSYATAVFDMHDNGISLIPGSVNAEFTRGHPLLFYFCAATWAKIFGATTISLHLFALLISILALIAFYALAKSIFNNFVAIVCVILLSVQSWFWVQSVFLLPEVLLALLTLLSVRTYFQKKWLWFCIYSSLMVMTKETGWVLLIALFCYELIKILFIERSRSLVNIKFLLFPFSIIVLFLIIQKIRLGWLFFPGHIGMIHTDIISIYGNFTSILETFFISKYHFLFLIPILIATVGIVSKRIIIEINVLCFIVFTLLFLFGYILFSSINFYTTRYLICILPFYMVFSLGMLDISLKNNHIKILILSVFFIILLISTVTNKRDTDFSIAYKESVLAHKNAVNFCERNNWQHKPISVSFVSRYYFDNQQMGYLMDSIPFDNFNSSNPEIILIESCDYSKDQVADILKDTTKTITEFTYQRGWIAVVYNKSLLTK